MSTKYSFRKGPQGLPPTCKRQPEYCEDVNWPPPTLQSLVTFHGTSDILSALQIVEVITLELRNPPANIWETEIKRDCLDLYFLFHTHGRGLPIYSRFIITERGAWSVIASSGPSPYVGTKRYDTLRHYMNVTLGTGMATFRVTL